MKNLTRRAFLQTSAAASAAGIPMILPSRVLGGPEAPSNRLNIAAIGLGSRASRVVTETGENIVALCDVDLGYAAGVIGKFPGARVYQDFRVLLEKEKGIDAVMVCTPDHMHAAVCLAAMERGKHVFCEKPLTHDIYEARVLTEAARKYEVVTQMGIQGHASDYLPLIAEWIADGAIGTVREVDAWCSLKYSPPGHAPWSSILLERPSEGQRAPAGLDWDLWIGPAPLRPYHRCYHPMTWRCWWDFGCGMMGDRGAHTLDPVVFALKLGWPESIEGSDIVGGNSEVHPDQAKVVFKFPAREGFPPLTLHWYEGQEPPRPAELEEGRAFPKEGGSIIKGEKGAIMAGVYGDGARIIPETAMQAYVRPPQTLPRVRGGIVGEWTEAIKKGTRTGADFRYSGPLTEVALLGNLGKRFPGIPLEWDAANLRVTNHEEANAWVRRPRRPGWELE